MIQFWKMILLGLRPLISCVLSRDSIDNSDIILVSDVLIVLLLFNFVQL